MEVLKLEPTANTPTVQLDHINGKILFKGESRPEKVKDYFAPILKWFRDYTEYLADNKADKLEVTFEIDYFNSSSAKYLLNIFDALSIIKEKVSALEITWYHDEEDEDMLSLGEEMSDLTGLELVYKAL